MRKRIRVQDPIDRVRQRAWFHAYMRQCIVARISTERLCRYITRPEIANERLKRNPAGQVVVKLKSPYRDGTTHIVMSPLELMQLLAALVPRPRLHLIRFHGVLAPYANLRPPRSFRARRTCMAEAGIIEDDTQYLTYDLTVHATSGPLTGRLMLADGSPPFQCTAAFDTPVVADVTLSGRRRSIHAFGNTRGEFVLAGIPGPGGYSITGKCDGGDVTQPLTFTKAIGRRHGRA
jgi:hypothetical protein